MSGLLVRFHEFDAVVDDFKGFALALVDSGRFKEEFLVILTVRICSFVVVFVCLLGLVWLRRIGGGGHDLEYGRCRFMPIVRKFCVETRVAHNWKDGTWWLY